MKLVNAGLESKEEFAKRMIDGEVFYRSGEYYWWNSLQNIFVFSEEVSEEAVTYQMKSTFEDFEEMKVEIKWYEDLGEGVLCWVHDDGDENVRGCAKVIKKLNVAEGSNFKFIDSLETKWEYATPVTVEDLQK